MVGAAAAYKNDGRSGAVPWQGWRLAAPCGAAFAWASWLNLLRGCGAWPARAGEVTLFRRVYWLL